MKNFINSYKIINDLSLQETGAIEIIISLENGDKRWCFFITPIGLTNCGNWINGTKIRFHYGLPHMIVVAEKLDEELIDKTLKI